MCSWVFQSFLQVCVLVTALLCITAARAVAQSPPNPSQQPTETASTDSPSELPLQKAAIDRRLSVVQSQLASWRLVNVVVKNLNDQLTSTNGPSAQDFDNLEQLIKHKDLVRAKSQLARLINDFQLLNSRIFLPNPPTDPDVSGTINDWNQKLSALVQPLSSDWFEISQAVYRQEPLKADDFNVSYLRDKFSPEVFKKYKGEVQKLLKSDVDAATQSIESLNKEQDSLQKQSDQIAMKLAKGKLEINQLAIELGLPLFCGTVLLMLSVPIIIQGFSKAEGSADQVRAIFSSGILVEIITVLLLTMSILILGLANRIEGPVLGTLLGGISGYVLNRFRGRNQQTDDRDPSPNLNPSPNPSTTPNPT